MPRFVALLRAVNVGGHVVKMDAPRRIFESLDFAHVETFIASGNVVFETPSRDVEDLERRIEERLRDELGYEVATFVRSDVELAEVAAHQPFAPSDLEAATAFNVAFTGEPLDKRAEQKLEGLTTDIDDFRVRGREVYWLCRKRQSQSTFSNAALERTLGRPSTLRGASTVAKMAAKWGPGRRMEDRGA